MPQVLANNGYQRNVYKLSPLRYKFCKNEKKLFPHNHFLYFTTKAYIEKALSVNRALVIK